VKTYSPQYKQEDSVEYRSNALPTIGPAQRGHRARTVAVDTFGIADLP